MPDQCVHIVHLSVARTGVAASTVDFLHDDGGLGKPEAGATILLGDQRRHPPRLGERVDKLFGIGPRLIYLPMILSWKSGTECTDGIAYVLILVGTGLVHLRILQPSILLFRSRVAGRGPRALTEHERIRNVLSEIDPH